MTGWAIDRLRERPVDERTRRRSWWICAPARAPSPRRSRPRCRDSGLRGRAVRRGPRIGRRNLADTDVSLLLGDMVDALPELDGTVDLVIANPPYIPLEAYDSVVAEARDHDPTLALFSGDDGLDAIRVLTRTAARLLRPGRPAVRSSTPRSRARRRPTWSSATGAFRTVRDHLRSDRPATIRHGRPHRCLLWQDGSSERLA